MAAWRNPERSNARIPRVDLYHHLTSRPARISLRHLYREARRMGVGIYDARCLVDAGFMAAAFTAITVAYQIRAANV